jgi:hypothetical protein
MSNPLNEKEVLILKNDMLKRHLQDMRGQYAEQTLFTNEQIALLAATKISEMPGLIIDIAERYYDWLESKKKGKKTNE